MASNWFVVLLLGLGAAGAFADELPDWLGESDAVAVEQGKTPTGTSDPTRRERWFVEGSTHRLSHDASPSPEYRGNLGLDLQMSRPLVEDWAFHLGGRVDVDATSAHGQSQGHDSQSLTLREIYAGGRVGSVAIDVGRIIVRDGVSPNFNPSDVFRAGALTARRTENPARLKESRLGVVGLRAQSDLGGGSVSAMLVPKLETPSDPNWYDPQWGAVNDGQAQGYLMYTLPGWQGVYANVLAHQQQDGNSTFGLNASKNIGQAWVASLEMASTRRSRFADLAQDASPSAQRFAQAAAALSFTTESRQTLTLEYDFNGAGLTRDEWLGAWQSAGGAGLRRAMGEAGRRQEPLGAHSLMAMLQWDRFLVRDSQLDFLVQYNAVDRSRLYWLEWRYQFPNAEVAVNGTRLVGSPRSQYGAADTPWTLGLRARFFF